jgi:mRNA interferase YafQ
MLKPVYTRQFEKDIKLAVKRGKDTSKIKALIIKLLKKEILPARYRDHKLSGKFRQRRECHIEPDWLMIYKIQDEVIIFERTGTHADLFE